MLERSFNKMKELTEFVNDKKIKKEDIVNIFQNADGLFTLVYYER